MKAPFETSLVSVSGQVQKHRYLKNRDIFVFLKGIGKTEKEANEIIVQLQNIRSKHDFFSREFKHDLQKKISYFTSCLWLIKRNKLPLFSIQIRDSYILTVLGPYFLHMQKRRSLKSRGIEIKKPKVNVAKLWKLIESYEIPYDFIKALYRLHDSDLDDECFETILKIVFLFN